MGQLSDAIREHLELQRRHGVPDEEISKREAEALGPVRREPDAASPGPDEDSRSSSSSDAETALVGSGPTHEEPVELEDADDADPASVFPEPDPTVLDERMSAENPPPVGPRPLVDEAPVIHDEPLAEDPDADFAGPPREAEPESEPVPESQALPFGAEAEPDGPAEPDPFATQPHTLPGLEEDERSEGGRPALLDEDEPEAFEEWEDEPPAGADVEEEEEAPLEEDTPVSLAYEEPVEDDTDFDPGDEAPRSTLAPPPRDSGAFDFDA